MINIIVEWMIRNWIEILGTLFGISYVFLSIRQNILTWLLGLLSSVLYIYVFFVSKFYADMGLQVYYVWISIYGWYLWTHGNVTANGRDELAVVRIKQKLLFVLSVLSVVLWIVIYFILVEFTDSPLPIGDSFTTALSIVATWMLAKKIIEHWIIWILVDLVSLVLYVYKGLYPTSVMFIIYTLAAIWGFYEWRKNLMETKTQTVIVEN
jgi:nicotinamide mononucleotide transporter